MPKKHYETKRDERNVEFYGIKLHVRIVLKTYKRNHSIVSTSPSLSKDTSHGQLEKTSFLKEPIFQMNFLTPMGQIIPSDRKVIGEIKRLDEAYTTFLLIPPKAK